MKKILFILCLLPVFIFGQTIKISDVSNGLKTNTLYGVDYGITVGGVVDNTAAFNAFMAACKAGNYDGELPLGTIRFASKPNNIDFGWNLGGKGLNGTILLRDYNETNDSTGILNIVGASGIKIHDMAIESASGKTGGCMISAISSSTFAISGLVFENLWLSTFGSNTQVYTLYLSGGMKTSAPTGIRDVSLKNVHAFGSTNFSVYLKSVIGLSWMGGGVYPAGGTGASSGGIAITGVTSNYSQYVTINVNTCGGLNLTKCVNLNINAPVIGSISGVSINNDNTCSRANIVGQLSGTQLNNWLNSNCNNVGTAFSVIGGPVNITNASAGTDPANVLKLQGSTADNSNYPGISFVGGTGTSSHAYIQTNNSGLGLTIANGTGSNNQQAKLFFYNGSSGASASAYADLSFNSVSRFRFQSDGLAGIGSVSAPGAVLHVGGGGTGTPNMILNSQTGYTGSTDGSVWNNSTSHNIETVLNGTKYTIVKALTGSATLDFPSTLAQTDSDLTITVTGAADGDPVDVGMPNGSTLTGATYTGWVSSANTVTIRLSVYGLTAKDPASGTFKVTVFKN